MPFEEPTYREVLDHLLEGFQILDRDLRYVYVNPTAAAQGKSTPEALVGRLMAEAYPGIEHTAVYAALKKCADERVPASLDNLFTYPDGTQRWFLLRIEPIPQGVCVHSVDIDDRKRAEAALVTLNAELESLVAERTNELELSNRELEAFSYSVSHDLRGPLRAIDGFAQALAEDSGHLLDETGREHLERIRRAAQRMGLIIDDLLMLARVTRKEIRREDVDLSELANAIKSEMQEREPGRVVTWRIAGGLQAYCDRALARVALANLLDNAWKFTSKKTDALIEVRPGPDGAVVVADNGAGFDMRFADKLFLPFSRLHRQDDFPGTGIGLATVRRIVDKHGGTVTAFGEPERGVTMTLRFDPVQRASSRPSA